MARAHIEFFEKIRICNKNFRGEERRTSTGKLANKFGTRHFSVILPIEKAEAMAEEGWNIGFGEDSKGNEVGYLPIEARYNMYPPRVKLVDETTGKKRELNEDSIDELDRMAIRYADVVVSPRPWTKDDGSTAIKAYLKSAQFYPDFDPLEAIWASEEYEEE